MEGDFKKQDIFSPRRSTRPRKQSLRAQEYASASGRRQGNKLILSFTGSESESDECEPSEKPSVLHDNDHVSGDKLFTFQTRKKCEAVIPQCVPKTPHTVRNKVKKDIVAQILEENDSSGADFSDSGSEYVNSDEESETEVTSEKLKENPANVYEACDLIEREFSYILDTHLYLIIHNIDMMRSGKAQSVFARLAAVSNIHLIASIDHINAPLIWDHSKLSKFNFTWWDVTTFHPYIDETSFESSMMVQRTGTLALSSLRNVFLSLTSNSKGIYLILVKYQIENGKKQYYQGLAFKDLYSLCREAFLVSSDLALRAQLTEFVDHKMVKFKRSPDGTEYLIIPIPNTVLQQFLTEQSNS
ncbi:hypothetical protein MTP99_014939 [Tenebrio molitor]|nr:hypothetical protein MTP99_014939 [Tenebrio molitor]